MFFQYYKLAVAKAKRDGAATILLQIIATVSVLFLVPLFSIQFPTSTTIWLMLIAACVFYAMWDRLQTTVRKHLPVSTFSIMNQFTVVYLIIIGITFFAEPVNLVKVFGAAIIILGNVILFYRRDKINLNRYAWLGILGTLIFAIALSIDVGISSQFNLPLYIAITLGIPAAMLMLVEKHSLTHLKHELKSETAKYYLVTGIFWALSIFFSLRAYRFGEVSTIAPLQATNVVLNVIVAYFLLGEKKDLLKKSSLRLQ